MSKTLGNFASREQIADYASSIPWMSPLVPDEAVTFGTTATSRPSRCGSGTTPSLQTGLEIFFHARSTIGRYFDGVVPARGEPT